MQFGLGTAQFGSHYGISNNAGQPGPAEIGEILRVASAGGVGTIDTAATYGESERLLGSCLPRDGSFKIITKTPRLRDAASAAEAKAWLEQAFEESRRKLGRDAIYGLLLHSADDLRTPWAQVIVATLQSLVEKGHVQKIGLSAYTPDQINTALQLFVPGIIQIPLNVLDQRLLQSGYLDQIKSKGVEIHARSAFLQGLLLMNPASIPARFSPILQTLQDYEELLGARKLTRLQGALAFMRQINAVDQVIVGVNRADELAEILEQARALPKENLDFTPFAIADENMVLPMHWNT